MTILGNSNIFKKELFLKLHVETGTYYMQFFWKLLKRQTDFCKCLKICRKYFAGHFLDFWFGMAPIWKAENFFLIFPKLLKILILRNYNNNN